MERIECCNTGAFERQWVGRRRSLTLSSQLFLFCLNSQIGLYDNPRPITSLVYHRDYVEDEREGGILAQHHPSRFNYLTAVSCSIGYTNKA